jgi:hypothetical protein
MALAKPESPWYSEKDRQQLTKTEVLVAINEIPGHPQATSGRAWTKAA